MAKGCVDVDYTHIRDAVSPFSASKASTTKGACEADALVEGSLRDARACLGMRTQPAL
jgi:hypothetical protein